MSNQVYNNDETPTPNVYVSQLIGRSPSGGIVTRSLTLTDVPGPSLNLERPLVRNSSGPDPVGLVELGGDILVDRLSFNVTPFADGSPEYALVANSSGGPTTGNVQTGLQIKMNKLLLTDQPVTNNSRTTCLTRAPGTGLFQVEQRELSAGTTARTKDASQTVAFGVEAAVLFPVSSGTDAGLTYDDGTGVFTVATAGQFSVAWTIAWALDLTASGVRSTWMTTSNGGTVRYGQQIVSAGGVPFPLGQSSCVSFSAPAASTFQIHAFQTTVPAADVDMVGTSLGSVNVTLINITRATIR
jgi:hypothetical protein